MQHVHIKCVRAHIGDTCRQSIDRVVIRQQILGVIQQGVRRAAYGDGQPPRAAGCRRWRRDARQLPARHAPRHIHARRARHRDGGHGGRRPQVVAGEQQHLAAERRAAIRGGNGEAVIPRRRDARCQRRGVTPVRICARRVPPQVLVGWRHNGGVHGRRRTWRTCCHRSCNVSQCSTTLHTQQRGRVHNAHPVDVHGAVAGGGGGRQ